MMVPGNLLDGVAEGLPDELIETLAGAGGVRIERIVSKGHSSPDGFWYDQESWEWVMVVTGAARLRMEREPEPLSLGPGDYATIPPHTRHRVDWTDPEVDTVWLAVHYPPGPTRPEIHGAAGECR